MLAYAHRKAVPEYTSELLVFTGVPEEAHAVSWRWLWLRLPVLLLSYFPREGWEANTTHAFDPFQSRLLNGCLLERRGRERDSGTAVARQWLGSARLGSAACPGHHVAAEKVQTPRIPDASGAGSGGARCGSIREAKQL